MDSSDIRKKFLDYFKRNGHTVVPSSSLIPAQDPSLLFANAGMNQFKDLFLGNEKRSYTKATSCQKCVRAGGKHNDLDMVGFSERHLTFFEMLGNFSFGDYFKKEAISYAWEFLTKEMHLPPDKLYASVFKEDDDAFNIWKDIVKIPSNHIIRLGKEDNFWQMGDTGPCGPCSEIYIDTGEEKGCKQPLCAPGCDCARFVEIWNLVFMQFDRQPDGHLLPLKVTGVDTGMGLERLCMIVQAKKNIYETDLFQHLIQQTEKLTGVSYQQSNERLKSAFHVLADHVRSTSLLIADSCSPSNEGRGYVLRKIIRRAALFAQKLSTDSNLFPLLSQTCVQQLETVYPELKTSRDLIKSVLTTEVERFARNLVQGQEILKRYLEETKITGTQKLSGEQVFKLYDTYGFPPELTRVVAQEHNTTLDMQGFEKEMQKQQQQSGKKTKGENVELAITENVETIFVGYEKTEVLSKVVFVKQEDQYVWIITEQSPFYVESGGQINDKGWVTINDVIYPIVDLKKVGDINAPAIAVKLSIPDKISKQIKLGDKALCKVDEQARANTEKNHTSTHLLQTSLTNVVSSQIKQAGSLVSDTYLRFDFNHPHGLKPEQIEAVENLVNKKIGENIAVKTFNTTLAKAKEQGVISFFGEKYNPENVRVIQVPGFSAELCGGIHTSSTGNIGCFKIISETALSSGTRRIIAVTGPEAIKLFQQSFTIVKKLGENFKAKPEEVYLAVNKLQENYLEALGTIKQLKKQLLKFNIPMWLEKTSTIKDIPFCYLELTDLENEELKIIAQEMEKIKPGFYFLISTNEQTKRCFFIAYLAKTLKNKLDLKQLALFLKENFNLRGGGSPTMIHGGGASTPKNLNPDLVEWLEKTLV